MVPKEDSNRSSAELVFGCQVIFPGEFLDTPEPPAAAFMAELQDIQPIPTRQWSYTEVTASLSPGLQAARLVYIKKGGSVLPLSPPYDGPFSVVEAGPKLFTVDIDSRRETVSIHQLKPQTGTSTAIPAVLPRRGAVLLWSGPQPLPHLFRLRSLGGSPVVTPLDEEKGRESVRFKGTVSPDYKCLEVISTKSPLLGHVTPDI